ncbi:hypothetical protein HYW53_02935 [Candidatus Giovannonibacteria bacterium]|nr:hypothetical protein [Candidatus Giovannonibacteria bacterium]
MPDIFSLITAKPVLIGIHLGMAIVGIDAFLWLAGEAIAGHGTGSRARFAAILGVIGFSLSWLAGGYYYVVNYGSFVKPIILAGSAPWAHAVSMEAKEHIFLFIIPLALTALFAVFAGKDIFEQSGIRRQVIYLSLFIAVLGLFIGAMGFIISSAARWG